MDFSTSHFFLLFILCFINKYIHIKFLDFLTRATCQFTVLNLLDLLHLSLPVSGITFMNGIELKAERKRYF